MEMRLSPVGGGASRSFLLQSTGTQPVAVQLSVAGRKMSIDGVEELPIEEENFVLYPPQVILRPNQVQAVRVVWVGNPTPAQELPYRIIAEQVPIDDLQPTVDMPTDRRVADIKVLFRYVGTIYVTPPNASPKVFLEGAEPSTTEDGSQKLVLNFENQGTAHQLLRGLTVNLTSEGKTVTLSGDEQLKGVIGENILAGNKRRFVLPWPKELPVGPVTATFTTN
ncbi:MULTISPECIES: fimbria/pilus periplasmic chaperone [unclassified Synechocystis]|nr:MULTISPECIES: fimbria/pilus periplasmic chaperone [unclassified Synechocystis]UOO11603.1 fimbria/pilus periplasmic chaperone [Synechocystis sp. PCC 6803]